MHYNCLIVDDEEELARMTAEYFRMFDVSTAYVTSGKECFDFLRENGTDLILLDVSLYNDRIQRMYADLAAGAEIPELEKAYGCDIILSNELVDAELTKYYASGALVLDFAPEGEIIGKAAWDDQREAYAAQEKQFRRALLGFWGLVAASGYLFLFVIYRSVAKPIREFEGFAEALAKGRLDVQLPRRRMNLFGNFTESFDIMREELRDAREREVQANRAKREMAAGLSHDIKTPLATIRAACEVLEAKYPDAADMREKTAVIAGKADTINRLVNNLFSSTLEELEELPVTPGEVPASRIEGFFAEMNQQGDSVFDNHIPECLVRIDPIRMEQAVDNIVSNSRKYAGTKIHVSFAETEGAGEGGKAPRFIRITVRDTGKGVPEEDLGRITEKYFRGANAAGRDGYGLGMYLVKGYMERQGGGMEYYNDGGFVVELLVRKV